MPTDSGCAPGICLGQPEVYADECANINGCEKGPGYSSPDHTLVAVTEGTSAYDRAINDAHRRGRELGRAEMWSRLEMLAQDVSDGAYHVQQFDNERLADEIREVARG